MSYAQLNRDARVFVAGHRGLAGSAIHRHLCEQGFTNVIVRTRDELDLRDRESVRAFFAENRPEVVVLAAARVGGIGAHVAQPVEFISDNLRIQLAVLDAANEFNTSRLLFLGSACIYPKYAPQPIPETALLNGALEPSNDAYAIAKIAGIHHVQAMRREYGRRWICAMPTNLYGPGDNFNPRTSHVLAALIRRTHEARLRGASSLTHWGTGTPRREFLYVDDLASACLHLLEHYDGDAPVNLGTGEDIELREVAGLVAQVVGYTGDIQWDPSRPDGTPRRRLDVSRLTGMGWKAGTGLREGIEKTYQWFLGAADAQGRM